jgi:uncharacterized membrane protein YfcA
MDIFIILILIICGIAFGIIGSLAGIGGGAFYMSLMVLMFAIPIDEARDTSIFIILFFSFVGFLRYYQKGKINLKMSLVFSIFALLGSITASIFFLLFPIDNSVLKMIIASVVLIAGFNMIAKAVGSYSLDRKNGEPINYEFSFETYDIMSNLKKGIPWFFIGGFFAYLSGIGGGMLFVPILCILFRIPIHYSTAISTSMIFFIGIYNTTVRVFLGDIHYIFGVLIGIGAVIGSLMGVKVSIKIPRNYLQFGVACLLIILAVRMYFV